jgi:hypothetical protein
MASNKKMLQVKVVPLVKMINFGFLGHLNTRLYATFRARTSRWEVKPGDFGLDIPPYSGNYPCLFQELSRVHQRPPIYLDINPE